jgi:hypothetical protein
MADLGVVRDGNRLPWLEPYRAPKRTKKSNRRPGAAAAIGAIGLAGIVTLLMRDAPLFPTVEPALPQASVVLPAPAEMQQPIILPPLETHEQVAAVTPARAVATPRRAKVSSRRRIKAVPTRAAYRTVVKEQAGEATATEVVASEAAIAIAALPAPASVSPVRPTVNPRAKIVRGKTVQLGVYTTSRQAELAWQSAVRDYTYLTTMPKSIEPISIRSKRFYRLQLGTPSRLHAKQLCTNLKTIGRACTVA